MLHLSCSQPRQHLAETVEASLKVFDDLFGEVVGLRQVVQVRQALVPEPENIETGLVARADLLIAVAAPTALRCLLLVPGRLALVPVPARSSIWSMVSRAFCSGFRLWPAIASVIPLYHFGPSCRFIG